MLARHPITGNPIKIIKTQSHVYKNTKTLLWLRTLPGERASRYARWDTLVTSVELAEAWHTVFGHYPSAILLTHPTEATLKWIKTKAPRSKVLLFLNKCVMNAYGLNLFTSQKFANVVCLDEMGEMYPHIQHTYKECEQECITVASIGAIFRVRVLTGFLETELADTLFETYTLQLKQDYAMEVCTQIEPPELWLLQQYYVSSQAKRAKELRTCLDANLQQPYIDKVLLLNETDLTDSLPTSTKLTQYVLGHRLTYADIIHTIQTMVPPNTFVVFANSDIYLDDSWRQLWYMKLENVLLALLRYEAGPTPTLFGPRADSQDTWVVNSSDVQSRTWDPSMISFPFGKSGCDNAIALEFLKKKFIVANPCLSLKTIHYHTSGIRTYDPKDVVDKPIFLYLEPTGLHDLEPLQALESYQQPWILGKPFSRMIHSHSEQSLKTFCSMVSRQEKLQLAHDSENIYVPQLDERVYRVKHGFTTPTGLVYDYSKIYMGKQPEMVELWSNTTISHMTPCIGVNSVLGVSLTDTVASDLFLYLQLYLSRIFRLKEQGCEGEFWMPRDTPRLQEFMQYFKWKNQSMPVLPRDPGIVAYSPTTHLLTARSSTLCHKEDAEALRSMLRPYVETPSNPRQIVLIQDDTYFTSDTITFLESSLESKGFVVNVVYPARSSPAYLLSRILGVSICITGPGQEALFWMLPRGCRLIECMSELQIVGEGAHTAGACSLVYWVILMARAKQEAWRTQLVDKVLATLDAEPIVDIPETKLPLLLLPKGFTGLHSHSGDSFREMARLWFTLGYVELEYTTESPYVWLGGIGQTLLYDRANTTWLKETPASYKQILVGNPDAKDLGANAIQWSFWPRHPIVLEDRVEQGLLNYEARPHTLVFYGKVENSVQESHRRNTLYEACDEFSMPFGAETSYKYTQKEYLDELSKAKYGLCMAGFGPKCNREIECMALGTVPVVAPDVDMSNYAVPPQEGIHYLRLVSFDPKEALTLLHSISQERWSQLSSSAHEWWIANSSAKGLWALTQRLLN